MHLCKYVVSAAYITIQLTRDHPRGNISIVLVFTMTCGSTNLTDEKTSKTSKRRADSSNNSTHPTVSLDLISKRAKIEVTLAASEAGQMTQIESEFQILKSLIPNIANKQQINEVRIIYEFKIIVEGRNRKISFRLKSKYFLLLQHFFASGIFLI